MPDEPVDDAEIARTDPAAVPLEPEPLEPEPIAPGQVTPGPVAPEDVGYTPGGVPTFDAVREKIETRYGTAIGHAELDAETPEGRSVEEQYEARQRAAAERLAQIRAAMKSEGD